MSARSLKARLWVALGTLLLGIFSGRASGTDENPNEPDRDGAPRVNIVLAFADDLGRYASIYADPQRPSANDVVRTPHIDAVAAEGTVFNNAFVSAPSCTPSRAALLTGRHFFRNGSHSQLHHPWYGSEHDPWSDVRGMGLALQDAGYHIGWSYKMHLSENRMGGSKRNYQSHGTQFNKFSQIAMVADDPDAAKTKLLNEVRKNFGSFLADRQPGQPFFYWFNPTNTHRPWVQGSGQRLWGIDPESLRGRLPSFLPDDAIIREDFADYLGEAMAFDAAVGVLVEQLQAAGEWDRTVLVVSGDHGAPGFPRGKCNLYDFGTRVPLVMRGPRQIAVGRSIDTPVSLVDLAPTFLSFAGLATTELMDGQDLSAAVAIDQSDPESMLRDAVFTGRENHVDEARPGGLPYPMRAIRTADYLYVTNFAPERWPVAEPPLAAPLKSSSSNRKPALSAGDRRMDIDGGPTRDYVVRYEGDPVLDDVWRLGFALRPAEELYDVRRDPDQVENLIGQPGYEDVRNRLRERLLATLDGGGDPRVVGEGDAFDRPPYVREDASRGRIAIP